MNYYKTINKVLVRDSVKTLYLKVQDSSGGIRYRKVTKTTSSYWIVYPYQKIKYHESCFMDVIGGCNYTEYVHLDLLPCISKMKSHDTTHKYKIIEVSLTPFKNPFRKISL